MKKILCGIFFLLVMLNSAVGAAPLRIARLPLTYPASTPPAVIDWLEVRLDRAMHVPLNGILERVEYLPESSCEEALAEVAVELAANDKKGRWRIKEAMVPVAAKLNADLVIYPVLENYCEYQDFVGFWGRGPLLHSHVALRLYGYDKRKNEIINKGASRYYHSDYSTAGSAAYLVREAMEEVVQRAKVHERVYGKE